MMKPNYIADCRTFQTNDKEFFPRPLQIPRNHLERLASDSCLATLVSCVYTVYTYLLTYYTILYI